MAAVEQPALGSERVGMRQQLGSLAEWVETNLPKIMKQQQKRLVESGVE